MARCDKNGCFEKRSNPSWNWDAFHYPYDDGGYVPQSPNDDEVTAQ